MRYFVYPYKQGSKSAKLLADVLEGKVLKIVNSKYRPRQDDVIINWGSSSIPDFGPNVVVLNRRLQNARCKLRSFEAFKENGISHPPFAKSLEELDFLVNEKIIKYPVVCRTVLTGHSGQGIVIANSKDEIVPAPLYVQYVKKLQEYRVHCTSQNDYFIQRKALRAGVENPNFQVRNLNNGFVFVEDAQYPDEVAQEAMRAVGALGLDFGAVDVIWNQHQGKAFVLEVNTACGLEQRTALHYRDLIEEFVEL